jgi:hypothetical protein
MDGVSSAPEAHDNNNNLSITTIITDNDNAKKINVIIFGGENTIATNDNAIPPKYY